MVFLFKISLPIRVTVFRAHNIVGGTVQTYEARLVNFQDIASSVAVRGINCNTFTYSRSYPS